MKNSIKSLSFFALAVVAGASAFGLFWSSQAHARGTSPVYCPGSTASGPNATMCYQGKTVYNVDPTTQSGYLTNGTATCGACATSGQ